MKRDHCVLAAVALLKGQPERTKLEGKYVCISAIVIHQAYSLCRLNLF